MNKVDENFENENFQKEYDVFRQLTKLIIKLILAFFVQTLWLWGALWFALIDFCMFNYEITYFFIGIPIVFLLYQIYKIKPFENKVMSIIYWVVSIFQMLDYYMFLIGVHIGLLMSILEWFIIHLR